MNLTSENLLVLKQTALEAAEKAAHLILEKACSSIEVSYKQGMKSIASSVVTQVDKDAQSIISSVLEPSIVQYDLGVLLEESSDDGSRLQKDYFWCVDPMDGTLAFTENRPGYSVSIALISKLGEAMIGVVYDPLSNEIFSSVAGGGMILENKAPNIYCDDELVCFLDSSFQYDPFYQQSMEELDNWRKEKHLSKLSIHYGFGSVLNACSVLKYKNAVYFKFPKKEQGGGSIWDFGATACLFQQSRHAIYSDILGNPLNLNEPNTTFMNKTGVLYSSQVELHDFVSGIYKNLRQ